MRIFLPGIFYRWSIDRQARVLRQQQTEESDLVEEREGDRGPGGGGRVEVIVEEGRVLFTSHGDTI